MQQDRPVSGRLADQRSAERKSIALLSTFVLTAAALGFAGTYVLLTQRAAGPPPPTKQQSQALADALSSFEANTKYLDSIHKHILTEYQEKSVYPISATMQPVSVALGKQFKDAAPGKLSGNYSYWSDTGKDYKLIVSFTGDCFVARERRPEMVDPSRSWGVTDCIAYGYWTPGAKLK
jgi:soluble lytic murein transglycosylase-like protein